VLDALHHIASKNKTLALKRAAGRLSRCQRGQVAVEFMLMMILLLTVFLTIVSMSIFCSDLLVLRYASFVAARGYLSRADWQKGGEMASNLIITKSGKADLTARGDDGVKMTVKLKELFPVFTLFGSSMETEVSRETFLGKEPDFKGDNDDSW